LIPVYDLLMHYFLVVIESARDVKAFYTQIKANQL